MADNICLNNICVYLVLVESSIEHVLLSFNLCGYPLPYFYNRNVCSISLAEN